MNVPQKLQCHVCLQVVELQPDDGEDGAPSLAHTRLAPHYHGHRACAGSNQEPKLSQQLAA
jgi:hypothetical protein